MACVRESGSVKRLGAIDRNRQRDKRKHPAPVRELERGEHRNQENRHTQQQRHNDAPPQAPTARVGRLFGLCIANLGFERCRIPGVINRFNDLLIGNIGGNDHARRLQRQVHGGINPRNFAEFTFHATHAGCARHALNIQVDNARLPAISRGIEKRMVVLSCGGCCLS